MKHEDPDNSESASPELGPRFVPTAHCRMQPWFASAPNVGLDGLHALMLNKGPKVGYRWSRQADRTEHIGVMRVNWADLASGKVFGAQTGDATTDDRMPIRAF